MNADFKNELISPMLIGKEQPPFDDPNYIYELKLDGIRALAYLDKDTMILNKRKLHHTSKFPELTFLHTYVKYPCILDGELFVYHHDEIDFFEIQRRALLNDPFKIRMASRHMPASFTAFDILYYKDHWVMDEPLMKRKKLLASIVKKENERFAISRYIEETGTALFELTKQKKLEGIVAKRKDSIYQCDKRTKDWIKCKHLIEDDFVICGYIEKQRGVISFILGQYEDTQLIYRGHVTMGASLSFFKDFKIEKAVCPFHPLPAGNEHAIWLETKLVAIVTYMMETEQGSLRQPVLKAVRDDKDPKDCIYKANSQ